MSNRGYGKVEAIYTSAGCNKCPKALDWGGSENQLICAVSNSVALFCDKEPFEIKHTFNKHSDLINCVKWISRADDKSLRINEFLSSSKDKTVIVWRGSGDLYEPSEILAGHSDSVVVVDGMQFDDFTLVASASVDSTVRIWSRHSDSTRPNCKFNLEQIITSKMKGFALALKFYHLPISNLPVLLIGYENHKIELNVRLHNESDDSYKFVCLHTFVGHEDWIRDIDVCQPSQNQLLIASSSQDNYIRLWKLDSNIVNKKDELKNELIIEEDNADAISVESKKTSTEIDDEDDEESGAKKADKTEEELKLKSSLFTVHSKKLDKYVQYSMNLESVLYGHEDWIYTVKFHPKIGPSQPLILISASIDKTMVVWKYNEEMAIWIDVARAGEIGGNTLGFYGATFSPNAEYIVAHGYQGALHLWRRNVQTESLTSGIINSGHFDFVEDICWEPGQQYFLSVSKDQTTRFHGYWSSESGRVSWHELGRPQIHGYDLTCVAFVDRTKFVSGADEKLLRVFEAPRVFMQNLYTLSKDESINKLLMQEGSSLPQGASVPALGLSNKAVYDGEKKNESDEKKVSLVDELYKEVYFSNVELNRPPAEDHLLQNTLWPEVQKLYGHGYELFSVAVDTRNRLIASACKASKPEHATILIWQEQQQSNNQKLFKQIQSLKGHELTIVQMKFSNNCRFLLSVSRDRSFKLFGRQVGSGGTNEPSQFELVKCIAPKNAYHTRIIWSCDWSHDDKYFVTTSRDKRVCVWSSEVKEGEFVPETPVCSKNAQKPFLELEAAVTASAFAPHFTKNQQYLLAFGLENGKIEFYTWSLEEGFSKFASIEDRNSHHLTVKRLSFRQTYTQLNENERMFCLASCSDDSTVRLFQLNA